MPDHRWIKEFPGSVTICDRDGVILDLNDRAAESFREEGGRALIGRDLLDCHPEPARTQLAELLATGRSNVYTIEKQGIQKLIYQSPWYVDGQYAGLVELSLVIPDAMPHFVRSTPTP